MNGPEPTVDTDEELDLSELDLGNRRWRFILQRFRHNLMGLVGLVFVGVVVLTAVLAPLIATHDPMSQSNPALLQPMTDGHLLGTDSLGRDIFSRLVYGARYALLIGLGAVFVSAGIGITLGTFGGYFGGLVDRVVMRLVDIFLGIPILVLAMAISGILGGGLRNVIIAVGVAGWARFARLTRGETVSIKENEYIEAAINSGTSHGKIILRHVLPNAIGPIVVYGSLYIASAILWSAALSFLGLGAQPPTPVWGAMIGQGRDYLTIAWWIATFPGLAITLTVLGFNFLGDGIRDSIDPRQR
jgi:peptide/nickel transport system permease protein